MTNLTHGSPASVLQAIRYIERRAEEFPGLVQIMLARHGDMPMGQAMWMIEGALIGAGFADVTLRQQLKSRNQRRNAKRAERRAKQRPKINRVIEAKRELEEGR